jgi:outer membrane protein assembly factor BamB
VIRAALHRVALGAALLVLAACGGGDGGDGSGGGGPAPPVPEDAPVIEAHLVSWPTSVPGVSATGNTFATVRVRKPGVTAVITDATVSINGTSAVFTSRGDYRAQIPLAPGATATVSVTMGGRNYSQAIRSPTSTTLSVVVPQPGAEWADGVPHRIEWISAGPGDAITLFGVVNARGEFDWPRNGPLMELQSATTSYDLPGGALRPGKDVVLLGQAFKANWNGAATGSYIAAGLLTASAPFDIVARDFDVETLSFEQTHTAVQRLSSAIVPLIGKKVADGSRWDVRTSAVWTVDDPTKVGISSAGELIGVARGRTTVHARVGTQTASISVWVYDNPAWPSYDQATTAYQANAGHVGYVVATSVQPAFPPAQTWSSTLDAAPSYPLVVDSRVFTTTSSGKLYALSLLDGSPLWGPIAPTTGRFTPPAYGGGRVFVATLQGEVRAYEAASGALAWSIQLPDETEVASPPVAHKGFVYVSGAASDQVFALDPSNGELMWKQPGAGGTPAMTDFGLYVTRPCRLREFHPRQGTRYRDITGSCTGGRGKTAGVAQDSYVFSRDPIDTEPSTGPTNLLNSGYLEFAPAIPSSALPVMLPWGNMVFRQDSTVRGVWSPRPQIDKWTFTGDGALTTPPLQYGSTLFVGSTTGKVFALHGENGTLLWTGDTGDAIPAYVDDDELLLRGIGAAEGWIVVPTATTLRAWKVLP